MQDQYIEGQTPLDLEEKLDLIPSIITREDLNAFEQENILQARSWVMRKNTLLKLDIFNEEFIKLLHKKMYDKVWKWAGKYRKSNKNIGVEYYTIAIALRELLEDAKFWLQHDTYCISDLAVIFHHRLVKIHLFANGNGRHARLYADVIVFKYGGTKLSWGNNEALYKANQVRTQYISALRVADKGDYKPLLEFSKS
jgi:Fic-DOC domain mobile mystery protein B